MGRRENPTRIDTPRAQNRARLHTASTRAVLDILSAEDPTVVIPSDEEPTIPAENAIRRPPADVFSVLVSEESEPASPRASVSSSHSPFSLYGPAPRTPRRYSWLPILVVTGLLILPLLSWAYL